MENKSYLENYLTHSSEIQDDEVFHQTNLSNSNSHSNKESHSDHKKHKNQPKQKLNNHKSAIELGMTNFDESEMAGLNDVTKNEEHSIQLKLNSKFLKKAISFYSKMKEYKGMLTSSEIKVPNLHRYPVFVSYILSFIIGGYIYLDVILAKLPLGYFDEINPFLFSYLMIVVFTLLMNNGRVKTHCFLNFLAIGLNFWLKIYAYFGLVWDCMESEDDFGNYTDVMEMRPHSIIIIMKLFSQPVFSLLVGL